MICIYPHFVQSPRKPPDGSESPEALPCLVQENSDRWRAVEMIISSPGQEVHYHISRKQVVVVVFSLIT